MLFPPGWNSVDSATSYAKWFTYAGWASLFLLGIFEILAHTYGARKDALVVAQAEATKTKDEAEIKRLNKKIEEAVTAASVSTGAIEDAKSVAKEAQDRAVQAQSELAKFKAPRAFTPEQRKRIIAKCKTLPGQPFVFLVDSDPEAVEFLNVIEDILDSCGWTITTDEVFGMAVTSSRGNKIRIIPGQTGMACLFSPAKITELGPPARNLSDAITAEGIEVESAPNPTVSNPNAIYIVIGKKRVARR
jgi:hypothetical protein